MLLLALLLIATMSDPMHSLLQAPIFPRSIQQQQQQQQPQQQQQHQLQPPPLQHYQPITYVNQHPNFSNFMPPLGSIEIDTWSSPSMVPYGQNRGLFTPYTFPPPPRAPSFASPTFTEPVVTSVAAVTPSTVSTISQKSAFRYLPPQSSPLPTSSKAVEEEEEGDVIEQMDRPANFTDTPPNSPRVPRPAATAAKKRLQQHRDQEDKRNNGERFWTYNTVPKVDYTPVGLPPELTTFNSLMHAKGRAKKSSVYERNAFVEQKLKKGHLESFIWGDALPAARTMTPLAIQELRYICPLPQCTEEKTYRSYKSMVSHVSQCHQPVNGKYYLCTFCTSFHTSLKQLLKHREDHQYHRCGGCRARFSTADRLRVHVPVCTTNPGIVLMPSMTLACPIEDCNHMCSKLDLLEDHIQWLHEGQKKLYCGCGIHHATETEFATHVNNVKCCTLPIFAELNSADCS